ncbi:VOC family protein [Aurantimonas sp. MSK8Z-1]|uniref:VOC family protein n=1 Tax=Mangrovibrevibacter kandeliae TaxID=2968473 RepID=UPI002117B492|nr:VOC family protein [Aurantimonas sp. MSK8Z-1]MCW4116326.1 VOC family protein [Aurantimonas sp. MSK8Z-1]
MSVTNGKFVWYELMTSDAAAATAFYRNTIGWEARDSGMPGVSYTLLAAGGRDVGGLMTLPEHVVAAGGRPGWIGYVAVPDVDRTAARAKELGGTVHRAPTDIPGVGRFAVIADPHGAVLCPMTPAGEPRSPLQPMGGPGSAVWRELLAGELDGAFSFYSALFGWTKAEAMDMGPMGTYQLFAVDGETWGAMMTKPPAVPGPFWQYYFAVDAIDAAAGRVTAGGGQILNGPMEVPGGMYVVQCSDPQGAPFALIGPRG